MRCNRGFNGKTVEAFSNFLNVHLEIRLRLTNCIVNLLFYFINNFDGQGSVGSRIRAY